MNIFPALNTILLFGLIALAWWRFRVIDMSKVWDEIAAIKLRVAVQEKVAPCEHCRERHGQRHDDCGD